MITVDTIGRVRRAYFVQGRKIKAIARDLRLARNTVRDIVRAGPTGEATERRYVRDKQPLPRLRAILRMLKRNDRWIMLSNGHRASTTGYPWDDVVPIGRLYYEVAPDRCIWGSDWPHVGSRGHAMPDDEDLLALVLRYLPNADAVQDVLVHNPARLLGF